MPSRVAVTGARGAAGRALVPLLEAHPDVDDVVAIGHLDCDVRDPALAAFFAGVDTVVHLAFRVDVGPDRTAARDVNLGGFGNVLRCMEQEGVIRLVYPSSALAYGAHADTPLPAREDAPLRPNFQVPYAEHKAETEAVLAAWLEDRADVTATVLRPATVLGGAHASFLTRPYEGATLWGVAGYEPPLQFLHETDFVAALAHFTLARLPGTYNVAAEGRLTPEEVARTLGLQWRRLPEDVAYVAADLAAKAGLLPVPAGMVNTLLHPVVGDTRAAAAGWHPRRTNQEALQAHRRCTLHTS